MTTSSKDVLELIKRQEVEVVDLKFCDLLGTWQHFSVPAQSLAAEAFEDGLGFDGSSIRGFQHIQESDMLVMPDPETAFVDPIPAHQTLSLTCNIWDPIHKAPYTRDPRYVAQKAEAHLRKSGIAETSFWGPEVEFYLFSSLRFEQNARLAVYEVDSAEGIWNSASNSAPNLAYRPRHKGGYFPVPPTDKLQDVRSEIMLALVRAGLPVEAHHHEVGTAGQGEIDLRYDALTRMADSVMLYKYLVRNVAARHGLVATFMPKPLFEDNGSGMHTHQSLWKNGTNLFYEKGTYGNLSQTARHYIGGLLAHAPAILALAAPTTNSYRRLVPGYEAPVKLAYSKRNRSACVRIPTYSDKPGAVRIEFRPPDPAANPYLAFAAMLMAGLDGIERRLDPGEPMDVDLYEDGIGATVPSTPGSLGEVLDALERDQGFLLRGEVFTSDLFETYIAYKRQNELAPVAMRPHPYEFYLYHDA